MWKWSYLILTPNYQSFLSKCIHVIFYSWGCRCRNFMINWFVNLHSTLVLFRKSSFKKFLKVDLAKNKKKQYNGSENGLASKTIFLSQAFFISLWTKFRTGELQIFLKCCAFISFPVAYLLCLRVSFFHFQLGFGLGIIGGWALMKFTIAVEMGLWEETEGKFMILI